MANKTTTWIEVSLTLDGEAAEAVAQELQRWCYQGVAVEQADIEPDKWDEGQVPAPETLIVRGYFLHEDDESTAQTREGIRQALRYMNMLYPMPEPIFGVVDEADWANAWKAHYHPVRLGQRLLIHPQWLDVQPEPDDIVISLDPGMAFGTGTHPTTQLCMEALERRITHGIQVLDLGCGSGVLSILAAKLGAAHILALDIDSIAVQTTQENAAQNHTADKITAQTGSLENVLHSSRRFDLIVVNILARVIIGMCAQGLGQTVRPGGRAIFSGIIAEQVDAVEAALHQTGLIATERHQQGDWVCIEALREA